MAQNLRDRGYGSSMDNYLQQQKKKQTQQGPVTQKKEAYGPPASAAPNKNQQKYHSRQKTITPGSATVQNGNRVSGRSVGTIGAGKQSAPAPVSTQRISTVGYDRAASASPGTLTEAEFNRSSAMQKSYGTYDNYTRGIRVTGGGFYHLDAPDFTGMQAAQSQYEQAYETIMGNLAKREKDLETAASMTGTLRPDQEVARGRAVEEYLKAKDAAERISRDYQTMRQENERTQSAFRTENEKWRSTIREMGAVQKEYDKKEQEIQTLQKRQDELRAQSASANTRGQALARSTGTMDAGALEFIMNARDEISRIDRQIQNLREDQALLNEEMEWSRYFRWQGFADQSIPISAQRANGGMNLLENEADYRTRFNQAVADRSGIRSRAREGVNRLDSDAQMTKYMTADERRIYENLYRQQGPEIAQQYFDELRSMDLNTRRRIREEDALRAAVRDDPVGIGTAGMNLMTVLLKPLQAVSFLGQTAEMLTTGKMTKDAAYNRALYMINAVRGETGEKISEAVRRRFGENWGKWGEFGYQTGMSMLDFLYNTWLTGGFSVDKGALAAYQGGARTAEALAAGRAYKAAEQFGLLLMSSEAAADATMQAKDRGLSDGQSYALGCIAGTAEYVTEKISLENLLDMVNAGGGVKEQIWYALKNRIAEASEEGASDMINLFADILITKDKSEWQTAIRAYQAQGLSENEAFIKALTNQAEQTGMSMAGGWLSGGTMSNVMLGLNAGRNYIQNRDTITGADYVGSIIRQAEGLKEGSAGYQAAQALQARLDAGERLSVREVLNAQKRIDTERRTERKYVRTQIREAERYEGTEAAEQAEVLREKLARGEDVSIREINRLEDALDEARSTDPETLRPVIVQGMVGDPNSEAYRAAQELQAKLDAGQRITLKEAARASQTIRTAVEQDLQSRNAEAIGRRLVTEDGQAALAEAADTVAAYGSAEMQARAAEIREQMRTGEIDARTAGEVFLESERIWNRQQERAANTRVLQPREVTEGMTELERTAAEIGVSEQETARVKAVADLLGADVRYFSEEAERFQRDGRNLIRTKNGYYDKATGTIWLNAQSTNPVMTVLSHELTHSLEITESYGEFRKLVLSMAGELRSTIEQTYESQNLDPEDIDHEVVARYVEEHLLTDEAAIRDAVQRNRSFGQWMRDQLDKVLAKLGNEDARERVTLRRARDLYTQALKEKAASQGETDGRLRLPSVEEQASMTEEAAGLQGLTLPQVQDDSGTQITREDVDSLRSLSSRKIAELSSEELRQIIPWARKFNRELGVKSPFFRAWFGDWRSNDSTEISVSNVTASTIQKAEAGKIVNDDTGKTISWGDQVFRETKIHAGRNSIAPYVLRNIQQIAKNAILLDSEISESTSKSKMKNTAFMHCFYTLCNYNGQLHLLKLYVEEALDNRGADVFTRAYEIKDVREIAPVAKGVLSKGGLTQATNAKSDYSVADLYALVKQYDRDFKSLPSSKIVNADGTPKVMYRGDMADFTVFDRKKARGSNLYGRGFYFTDSESHAKQYGKVRAFYLDVKQPLSPGQNEITREQMRAFLEAVAENEDDYDLQNYGYGATVDSVLDQVYGKGDFEMLQDVSATAIGDMVAAVELFNEVNGTKYDGIITGTETVTFQSTQNKSATDNIGTYDRRNPDIEHSFTEEEEGPRGLELPAAGMDAKTTTQNFKRWFGDWQKDPAGASKVVNADGTPKMVFHQTAKEFWIFSTDNPVAGKYDSETPNGIFFKDNDHDIGIGGKRQIAVYLNIRNPLRFKSRVEANRWYCKNIKGYAALQKRMNDALQPFDQRLNDIENQMFADGVTDEQYEALDKQWNSVLEQMREAENDYRSRLRGLLDDYFIKGKSKYDGIILDYDGHRYVDGKRENVKSYIVFKNTQIKSATDNVGAFDPNDPDIRYSFTEEEEGPLGLQLPGADTEQRIRRDAPEEERYEILKEKKLTAKPYDKSKLEDVELSQFETLGRTETEKLLRKIGEQFGVFKKYRTRDVAVEFQFSRNNLGESVHKQGGRYGDYAKMLTVFDDVIENAVGIETHSERYDNPGSPLTQMYVLASAFKTEDGVIPVLMEVKEFSNGTRSSLHLTISLNAIAEADIVAYVHAPEEGTMSYTPSASEYRIADIFKNVNIKDGELLKYIPDGFLTDEQRAAKQKALERTEQYIAEKNRRRYSQSITEEEDMGLQLPRVEDTSSVTADAVPPSPQGEGIGRPAGSEEAPAEAPARKKTKPVAESRPIEARRWLNRRIMDSFGVRENRTEAAKIIQRYADKALRDGRIADEDVSALFGELYDKGAIDIFPDEYSRTMRQLVTGGQIFVDPSVRADFGDDWNTWRKRAFAAGLMLTNTSPTESSRVMGIDMIWHEASELGPGTFRPEVTDPRKQLEIIIEAAEAGKKQQMNLGEYLAHMQHAEGMDMAEAAEKIMDRMAQDFRTFGEMAGLEIRLRDRTGVKIAQERERFGQVRDKEFRKAERIRKEERAHFREVQERARERRQISELRHKYLKSLQWLKKNQFRAPEELRETWDELLGDMDLYAVFAAKETGMYDEEKGITIGDALNIYAAARETENFLPSTELEKLWSRVHGEHVGDLDIDELQARYQAITALQTEFFNRNRVLGEMEDMMFSDVYDGVREDMARVGRQVDGKAHTLRRMFNDEMLTPMNMLRRMVGWNKDSTFVSMARQLEQGERTYRRFKEQAAQLLDKFLQENADWVRKADGTGKDGIWHTFEVPELLAIELGNRAQYGETVTIEMTPLQLIQLYLESKNFDNLRHIAKGGRTFADRALWQAGNKADGKFGKTVKLSPETIKGIVKTMTPQELELAQLLEHYYNVWSKPQINRVSNALDGFDKAMTGAYAPMHVNQDVVKQEIGTTDIRAKSVPNMRSRIKGAVAATFNTDALEAWQQSVEDTAKYVGYAIAERNWNCMMNYWSGGRMLRDVIRSTWGSEGVQYITKTVENLLSRGERSGRFVLGESTSKLLSNYIAATFGANPGIVLKQSASLPQFAALLGWKTLPSVKQIAGIDEDVINAYTAELAYRKRGYATPETAQLKNTAGKLKTNKTLNFIFGGGAIIAMDAATVKTSWAWAENYVRKNYPELEAGTKEQIQAGDSEFYRKVAEIFEDAVNTTQPMYDEMHRAGIMKDSNGIMRAFTMFKTVPLQQYNTLRRLFGELGYAQAAYKADPSEENGAALRQARRGAANAATATVGSVLMLEAVELLNALWKNRGKKYRDDDDELTALSIAENVALKSLQDAAGMVIGGKELTEWISNLLTGQKWYGIEIPGGEQLNDFIDTIGSAAKGIYNFVTGGIDILQNGEDFGLYLKRHAGEYAAAVKELAEKTAMYFRGLPIANVEKYIMGGVQFFPELSQAVENVFGYTDRSKLNGKTGPQLEKGVTDLFGLRGMQISGETAAAIGTLFENGKRDAVPAPTPDALTIDEESVKLTESQKQRWERTWSRTGREVDALVRSDAFKNADDETKTKMLNKLYELARIEANKTVPGWETDSKLPENVKTITDNGGSVADAVAWYGMTGRQGIKDTEKMQILADMRVSEQVKEAIFRSEKGDRTASDDGTLTAYGKLKAAQEAGLSVTQYAGFAAELGDSGVSDPDTYRVLARQKLSDDQKAALFGTLGTPDEDGTQRQERMAFVRSAGMKVDDYLKWCETECTQANMGEKLRALADADMSDRDRKIILSSLFSNRDTYQRDGQKTDYAKMQELINAGMPVKDYCTVAAEDALTEYKNILASGIPKEYAVEAAKAGHDVKVKVNEQRYDQGLPTGDWVDYCVEAMKISDPQTSAMAAVALMPTADFEKVEACVDVIGLSLYIEAQSNWRDMQRGYQNETGEELSMKQDYVKIMLDNMDCTNQEKAWLFQMMNKSWTSAKNNPYSSAEGDQALRAMKIGKYKEKAEDEPKGLTLPYIEN